MVLDIRLQHDRSPQVTQELATAQAGPVAWRCRKDRAMQVFLETDRLVLRRFSLADVDNLVNLDADPDVMRYVTGGIPTSREEIQDEFLPAFLDYYQRYEGYGFWAAIEKATGEFLGWFHFRPGPDAAPADTGHPPAGPAAGYSPGSSPLGARIRPDQE